MKKRSDGRIQTLVDIGLTRQEAAMYLCALDSPLSTIADIAKTLHILGPSAHRTLKSLRGKQLVHTSGTKPMNIRALSPSVAFRQLIDKRYQEDLMKEQELEKQLVKQKTPHEELRIDVLQDKKEIFSNDLSLIPHVKKELFIYSIGEPIPQEVFVALCEAIRRGVVVQLLVETYDKNNKELLHYWQKNGWFIRHNQSSPLGCSLVIYDSDTAVIQIRQKEHSDERIGIVFHNPLFVEAQRQIYRSLWEKGSKIP